MTNTATSTSLGDRAPPAAGHDDDLILGSRVKGSDVYNLSGDRIGHIEDLSIERATGSVRYALMSFGGFLGIGDRIHPIPWGVLRYNTTYFGYVVPLSKAELGDAPHYTAEELVAYGGGDLEYRDNIYQYYGRFGAAPYW